MGAYLDFIHRLAKKFTSISITQRPRNDVRHADALAYLAAALEVDATRSITIELKDKPSVDVSIEQFRDMYINACMFTTTLPSSLFSEPEIAFSVNQIQVYSRKRKREVVDVPLDKGDQSADLPLEVEELEEPITDGDDCEPANDPSSHPDIDMDKTEDWRTDIFQYLLHQKLPDDPTKRASLLRTIWKYQVVISTDELLVPTSKSASMEQETNDQTLAAELALLDETRASALEHLLKYQEDMKRRYDKRVRQRSFKEGDWVLKKVSRLQEQGKLAENWKGPYIIARVGSKGAYFLKTLDGDSLEKPWNAHHLKMFYR
ncbi:hypothetical protein ACHQM5_010542 [Ranunculus cassubicifolius]